MRQTTSFERRHTFVDTSAYFATLSRRDANHEAATRTARRLASERWRLFTTNFILAETHTLTLIKLGRQVAWRAIAAIREDSSTTTIRATLADERRAWEIVEQYDDKNFSMTDAISFAIMDRLGIHYAFHYDRNFTEYRVQGFQA